MILLDARSRDVPGRVLALFGLGLIGSSVIRRLERVRPLDSEVLPLDWQDPAVQRVQLAHIEEKILSRVGEAGSASTAVGAPRLVILWSAGRAGFHAGAAETERELESFRRVLKLVGRLRRRIPPEDLTMGLASSAGGLFEGQRAVHQDSIPAPQRPYGVLKLAQETILAEMGEDMSCRIYRLSSVYGSVGRFRRRGLIPTLIQNGLRHEVTRITGTFSTLRDYVWVDDVAAHVAGDLTARHPPGCHVSLLASTKPSSIFEVLRLVERAMGKPLYVSFAGEASNRADISFSPAIVPPNWQTTDLETTVRRIYSQALISGAGAPGQTA